MIRLVCKTVRKILQFFFSIYSYLFREFSYAFTTTVWA